MRLILTGGEFDRSHQAFWGNQTVDAMEAMDYHVVVIGTSGINLKEDKGIYVHGVTNEQITKGGFLKKETDYRIILADYSKIGARDIITCVKPDHLLENVHRQCLIVTTPPPEDDEIGWKSFEDGTAKFIELCRKLNSLPERRLQQVEVISELKLVVINPQTGEEDKDRSRSSKEIIPEEDIYNKNHSEERTSELPPNIEDTGV